jgi:hypothetical protein
MKTSLVIALTVAVVLAGGSALAVMNKACKSGTIPGAHQAELTSRLVQRPRPCNIDECSHRCGRS